MESIIVRGACHFQPVIFRGACQGSLSFSVEPVIVRGASHCQWSLSLSGEPVIADAFTYQLGNYFDKCGSRLYYNIIMNNEKHLCHLIM